MAKLLRIPKPLMPESFALIGAIIFLETASFYLIQSILPLLQNLNEPGADYYEKIVTKLPITFSTFEFLAMIIGAIFIDNSVAREDILIWPIICWVTMPVFIDICYSKPIIMLIIRFMAMLKGFSQPLIVSVGLQVYTRTENSKIYLFFMLIYCVYQFGIYTVQSLVPIDFIENNNCGNIDCITLVIGISSIGAVIACLSYITHTEYFTPTENGPEMHFRDELFKVIRILIVFIPFGIFWTFYQRINPQLTHLPKVIYLFVISSNDIPKLHTLLKVVIVILYYNLFYRWFANFILKHSTLLMTIGGILLGLWPIVASSMVFDHKYQYSQIHINPDAIQVTYISLAEVDFYIDIPFFNSPDFTSYGPNFVVIRDQLLLVQQKNNCPKYLPDGGNRKYCFMPGQPYVFTKCVDSIASIQPDAGVRDSYGNPVFCTYFCAGKGAFEMYFVLERNPSASNSKLEYHFNVYNGSFEIHNYQCRTILPGKYISMHDGCIRSTFKAEYGAVYVAFIETLSMEVFTKVHPFESSIINTRFVILYIIQAIGEVLLIINGFYFAYIQLHPKYRTIGLVLWLMMIKFGVLLYEIDRNSYVSYRVTDLYYLGAILICMAILFYILQRFFKFEHGDQSKLD